MPTCNRCATVRPSGELRRSPKGGHLCADKTRCERDRLAGLSDWGSLLDHADRVISMAELVATEVAAKDTMGALGALRGLHHRYADLAGDLVVAAAREGKTQKAIAETLGVPASTLRGLKQDAA